MNSMYAIIFSLIALAFAKELTVNVKVSGIDYNIRFSPEVTSVASLARKFCVEQGGNLGITAETLDNCVVPMEKYLQVQVAANGDAGSAAAQQQTTQTLQPQTATLKQLVAKFTIAGLDYQVSFYPTLASSEKVAQEFCKQKGSEFGIVDTNSDATNSPSMADCITAVARHIQGVVDAEHATRYRSVEVDITVEGQQFNLKFQPEVTSPQAVATKLCSERGGSFGVTTETLPVCIRQIAAYLDSEVSKQSKYSVVISYLGSIVHAATDVYLRQHLLGRRSPNPTGKSWWSINCALLVRKYCNQPLTVSSPSMIFWYLITAGLAAFGMLRVITHLIFSKQPAQSNYHNVAIHKEDSMPVIETLALGNNCTWENNSSYKYQLSMGTVFCNESHIMEEWLDHHRAEGVEHFYMVDNCGSLDTVDPVLRRHMDKGLATVYFNNTKHFQEQFYEEIIHPIAAEESKWLIIGDMDEFFYAAKHRTIPEALEDKFDCCSGVAIPWMIFGSNGHNATPPSIIQGLTRRADYKRATDLVFYFTQVKSIARTSQLLKTDLHNHLYVDNPGACMSYIHTKTVPKTMRRIDRYRAGNYSNKQLTDVIPYPVHNFVLDNPMISNMYIKVNHYRVQSKDYYFNVKMLRGDALSSEFENKRNKADFEDQDRNNVEDGGLAMKRQKYPAIPLP